MDLPKVSEIQQAEDKEVRRLQSVLETYRCDNGIPRPLFVEYLSAAILQEYFAGFQAHLGGR